MIFFLDLNKFLTIFFFKILLNDINFAIIYVKKCEYLKINNLYMIIFIYSYL